jgi:hypothetical protein
MDAPFRAECIDIAVRAELVWPAVECEVCHGDLLIFDWREALTVRLPKRCRALNAFVEEVIGRRVWRERLATRDPLLATRCARLPPSILDPSFPDILARLGPVDPPDVEPLLAEDVLFEGSGELLFSRAGEKLDNDRACSNESVVSLRVFVVGSLNCIRAGRGGLWETTRAEVSALNCGRT